MISYAALFFSAFIAATLVPMQSEAVLVGLLMAGEKPIAWLVAVATVGNVLGAIINWYVGSFSLRYQNYPWFPASEKQLFRARTWYYRYGRWLLLGSWLPIVGDPITLAAGALGERFVPFVILVSFSKGLRYVFLGLVTSPWL